MARRRRIKAAIPRSEDPLGIGLKSIPEPLQRWWLIGKGNPYLDEEVRKARRLLEIPEDGFTDAPGYTDWLAGRWKRHGHNQTLPVYLVVEGVPLRDHEGLTRHLNRDLQWPLENPAPRPCCEGDPLYAKARELAQRYGIDRAIFQPGFEGVHEAVAGYLLVGQWPQRRALGSFETIFEIDILADSQTGERFRERYSRKDVGLESRAGEGGLLPIWYEWWKLHRARRSLAHIADWTEERYGTGAWYDERSIQRAIREVERLLRPVTI